MSQVGSIRAKEKHLVTSDKWYISYIKDSSYFTRSSSNISTTKYFSKQDVVNHIAWCTDNCKGTWSVANYGPENEVTFRFYDEQEMHKFNIEFEGDVI